MSTLIHIKLSTSSFTFPSYFFHLMAQPLHVGRGIIPAQSGQIDDLDNTTEPRGLPILFHASPCFESSSPPFHSRKIDLRLFHPAEIRFRENGGDLLRNVEELDLIQLEVVAGEMVSVSIIT
jgi:hypothetical protein